MSDKRLHVHTLQHCINEIEKRGQEFITVADKAHDLRTDRGYEQEQLARYSAVSLLTVAESLRATMKRNITARETRLKKLKEQRGL